MRSKAFLLRLTILALPGVALLGAACGPNEAEERRRREQLENFNRQENENRARQLAEGQNRQRLASSEFSQPPQRVQLTDQPYIHGKLLVLRRVEPSQLYVLDTVTSVYGNFAEIRAQTPEEVGAVALLDYRKERAGTYEVEGQGRSVPGYIWACDLTLIDRSIPAVIYRRTFRGPQPGTEIAQAGAPNIRRAAIPQNATEVAGQEPNREVANYLLSLPRR